MLLDWVFSVPIATCHGTKVQQWVFSAPMGGVIGEHVLHPPWFWLGLRIIWGGRDYKRTMMGRWISWTYHGHIINNLILVFFWLEKEFHFHSWAAQRLNLAIVELHLPVVEGRRPRSNVNTIIFVLFSNVRFAGPEWQCSIYRSWVIVLWVLLIHQGFCFYSHRTTREFGRYELAQLEDQRVSRPLVAMLGWVDRYL